MTDLRRARTLCSVACAHYGLSAEATAYALQNASDSTGRAIICYSALLRSITVETQRYELPSALELR